ncbi:chromobox-like protein 5 [Leptotrombidium deliense]|uniref:Chromobox-like protein 5 n=1 Tax=Leptotrombidium deliense TaxID=299467 RepID=A0A443S9F5_9ACAR|nr:chromobox-like protein 5 [Leptotrombidium deliense]
MSDASDDVYDVEEIKAKRVVSGRTEYLVKWKGYDEESWEPSANILDDELIREFTNNHGKKRGRQKIEKVAKTECVEKTEVNNGVNEDNVISNQNQKIEPHDDGVQENDETQIDSEADVKCVLGATEINGQIYFLIQWSDENKEPEPFSASEANLKWPQRVIAFYQKHFEWTDK